MSHRAFRIVPARIGPAVAGAVLALVAVACGPPPFDASLARAVEYFEGHVTEVDPGWANLFGYYARRFDLRVTAADGLPLHQPRDAGPRSDMAALFRRLDDPRAAVDVRRIAALESVIDRMTVSALHCDRIPLPDDWVSILREVSRRGGYALTHAALAGQWTAENRCLPEVALIPLQTEQIDLLRALASDRAALGDAFRNDLDLFIETLAMLYYLGAGERVDPAWTAALRREQRDDGGWPLRTGGERSAPHPTALAIWVLLENLRPDAPAIVWVPQGR